MFVTMYDKSIARFCKAKVLYSLALCVLMRVSDGTDPISVVLSETKIHDFKEMHENK